MVNKRKIYVILLLLLILFVSLSFYYILHFCNFGFCDFGCCTIQEGLCLPSCNKIKFNPSTADIPDCSPIKVKLLQSNDGSKIYSNIINPFINNINKTMKDKYNYDTIFTLHNTNIYYSRAVETTGYGGGRGNGSFVQVKNENQIIMNSYFTDFSNNITLQDKMDNLVSNLSKIQNNPVFNENPKKDKILESLKKYEKERNTELLPIYKKLITDMEPYGENIIEEDDCANDENQHFYKDENFQQLIKQEKENLVTFSSKSTFHTLLDYINEAIQGKLGTTS